MSSSLDQRVRGAGRRIAGKLSRIPRDTFAAGQSAAPPDQGVNHDAIALACGLLSVADDLQGFILDESLLKQFDLRDRYGIDPRPLFQLNARAVGLKSAVRKVLSPEHGRLAECFPNLLADLHEVKDRRLLGGNTPGKMAFVQAILKEPLSRLTPSEVADRVNLMESLEDPLRNVEHRMLAEQLMSLRRNILDLLKRQWNRLPEGHDGRHAIEGLKRQVQQHVSRLDLLRFGLEALGVDDPRSAIGTDAFCESYCDQIVQLVGCDEEGAGAGLSDPSWRCVRGVGVEAAYVPRTVRFLGLGDHYGDCTARRKAKQLDEGIPNIHWTVYSWLLDPFYRVLEVCVEGEPCLKAHLTPLILEDEPILAVDAIEVIPKLRDTVRRLEQDEPVEREHRHLSRGLYARRNEILAELFSVVTDIGRRMGVERVFVDKYSNARWVRDAVNELPEEHYHIGAVQKPFDHLPMMVLAERWLGTRLDRPQIEIQARNLLLMDQGLRPGFKAAGILMGQARSPWVPVRGP